MGMSCETKTNHATFKETLNTILSDSNTHSSDSVSTNKKACSITLIPFRVYLFKANNRNTRARCEIYSKLTIQTPEQRHCLYC